MGTLSSNFMEQTPREIREVTAELDGTILTHMGQFNDLVDGVVIHTYKYKTTFGYDVILTVPDVDRLLKSGISADDLLSEFTFNS